MLPCQHLRGGHQRRLRPGLHRHEHRAEGNGRFAAAHVSLHQPGHGPLSPHIFPNFQKHPLLRPGGRETQLLPIFRFRPLGNFQGHAGSNAAAEQGQGHLIQQQFFKGDAPPGRVQRLPTFREMGAAHGEVSLAQAVFPLQSLRQLVRPLALANRQRPFHQLPKHLLGHAGNGLVHGQNLLAGFDGGRNQLQRPPANLRLAVQQQLPSPGQLFFQPGRIVPHSHQGFRAVGDIHPGNQKPPGPLFGGVPRHLHPVGGAFPGLCLAQGRTFPQIPIFPGQIHHQFPHAGNARVCQGLQAGRADALYFTQGKIHTAS